MPRSHSYRGVAYQLTDPHPAAEIFPWLPDDELAAMAQDIAANGLQYRILLLPDGRLVDGRNRELACRIAGVEPQYTTQDLTDDEILSTVISRNLNRRHLTPSQRAMVAAGMADLKRGGDRGNQYTGGKVAQATLAKIDDAAKALDVSPDSVKRAKKVKKDAPELAESVKEGKLDVKTAAKAAKLPKKKREMIAKSPDPKKAAAKELKKAAEAEVDPAAEFVESVERICRDIDQIVSRITDAKASRYAYPMHIDSAVAQIQAARKTLWQGRPKFDCPYCTRAGCKVCNMTGVVKKSTHEAGVEAVRK